MENEQKQALKLLAYSIIYSVIYSNVNTIMMFKQSDLIVNINNKYRFLIKQINNWIIYVL